MGFAPPSARAFYPAARKKRTRPKARWIEPHGRDNDFWCKAFFAEAEPAGRNRPAALGGRVRQFINPDPIPLEWGISAVGPLGHNSASLFEQGPNMRETLDKRRFPTKSVCNE